MSFFPSKRNFFGHYTVSIPSEWRQEFIDTIVAEGYDRKEAIEMFDDMVDLMSSTIPSDASGKDSALNWLEEAHRCS